MTAEPKPCLWCDRPRHRGLFCRWHSCLEDAQCFASVHWTTRQELADLYELMVTRSVDDLADYAGQNGARLVYQLCQLIRETAGPRLKHSVYSELKRRIGARRDKAPAPPADPGEFVPPPTLEPADSAADLGLEAEPYTLGLSS